MALIALKNFSLLHYQKISLIENCYRHYVISQSSSRTRMIKRRSERFDTPKATVRPLDEIIQPQEVPPEKHVDVKFEGVQSTMSRHVISSILDRFSRQPHIKKLAAEQNITKNIFQKVFQSFRLLCCSSSESPQNLDPALRVIFSDIINQDQSVDLIYPYFLRHARKAFPHLERINELRLISDLTAPHNWYPLARGIRRKIFFHAGPTNSGKTYEALEEFKKAKSGMYCGPLRLLSFEVYERVNREGIPCDMVTGEQRLFAHSPEKPAAHCTYTTEMLPIDERRDVCVIDEIQMLRDNSRGGAWTRALLGVAADEVYLCGEEAAIDIVCKLLDPIGEHVEIKRYKRKGELVVIDTHGLRDLSAIRDGDCIVHFDKISILRTARQLKTEYGRESAIIFGDLPPDTKREQIARFNNPADTCKVLLATDAIGMGMNLNIKRVIFSTLIHNTGELFPAYFVLQIAGRAGRFASRYCTGEVMTMRDEDSRLLGRLMSEPIEQIKQAGIGPSFEAIELFSMHLPYCSFTQLLDIFISIASVSDDFFIMSYARLKDVALLIEHIPLSLKDRYSFCLCPINPGGKVFLNTAFMMLVRLYSEGNAITFNWVQNLVRPEMRVVDTLERLKQLSEVYDFFYSYLWLSYRFEDYLPHREQVRELQQECGKLINESIRIMIDVPIETSKSSHAKQDEGIKFNTSPMGAKNGENRSEEKTMLRKGKDFAQKERKVMTDDFEKSFRLLVSKLKK